MNNKNNTDDKWLLDAEVRCLIKEKNGRWFVSLLFIDTHDPTNFLIKEINDYRSKRLAEIGGMYMSRTAAKDIRGTQKVKKDAYDNIG